MRRRVLIIIVSIVGVFALSFLVLYSFINVKLSDLNGDGELMKTLYSPNEEYRAELYLIDDGGATVASHERVSVTYLGDKSNEFHDETIYWIYPSPSSGTYMTWQSDNTIEVNGKIINIHDQKTYYNWKKDEDWKRD